MSAPTLRQKDLAFQANLYQSANPTRHYLHNVRRRWVLATLERVRSPGSRFLEVGIGCGVYTRAMSTWGPVTAIDINPGFVEAARQLPGVQALLGDICQQAVPGQYDVALCSEVLEHVPDSASALRHILASLRPGGHLVMTTPNAYSSLELVARLLSWPLVARLARRLYGEPVDDLGHINRMTRQQVRKQLLAAGFEVVQRQDMALYLPLVAEFGGARGAALCQWLERRLQSGPLSWLLWTQCWVVRKP